MLHTSLFPYPAVASEMPPELRSKKRLRFTPRHDRAFRELVKLFHRGSGLTVVPLLPKNGGRTDSTHRVVLVRASTTLKLSGHLQLQGFELTFYRLHGGIPFLTSEYLAEMKAIFHDSPEKVHLGWFTGRYVSTVVVKAAQSEVGIRIGNGTLIGTPDGKSLLSNK